LKAQNTHDVRETTLGSLSKTSQKLNFVIEEEAQGACGAHLVLKSTGLSGFFF